MWHFTFCVKWFNGVIKFFSLWSRHSDDQRLTWPELMEQSRMVRFFRVLQSRRAQAWSLRYTGLLSHWTSAIATFLITTLFVCHSTSLGVVVFLPCMPQIYQNWSFSVTRWLRVKESLWSKGGMRPLSRWLPWCILEWEILTVLLTLVVSLWLLGFLSVPFDWPGG